MIKEPGKTEQWLSLEAAAQRLGVHQTTLRRWADTGDIPVMVTPGGHRRFAMSDLDRFAEERRHQRIVAGIEQVWAERALTATRQQIDNRRGEPWMSVYSETEREHKRELGRRLMNILLQYISLKDGGEELLEEARIIGCDHAKDSLKMGMSLVQTLRIVLFFRDMLLDVALNLPEVAQVKAAANTQLLQRISQLLSVVELAVAQSYDPGERAQS
jgi:excisionase family DNA binding protein